MKKEFKGSGKVYGFDSNGKEYLIGTFEDLSFRPFTRWEKVKDYFKTCRPEPYYNVEAYKAGETITGGTSGATGKIRYFSLWQRIKAFFNRRVF